MTSGDPGVLDRYRDWSGRVRRVPRETVDAIDRALGRAGDESSRGPVVVRAGVPHDLAGAVEVHTEDGRTIACDGAIPADLGSGYHTVVDRSDAPRSLIVSPGRCPLPEQRRSFGIAVQLYATRSRRSWGIGDLADLRALAGWATSLGASALLVNPLHAPPPVTPQPASPYFPSSRRYRNPLYISVADVPGAASVAGELEPLQRRAATLQREPRIDRDSVHRLKIAALERVWESTGDQPHLDRFIEADPGVERYATHCALTERHGACWHDWPGDLRHPHGGAVGRFRRENERRVRFHVWLQWLLEAQLRAAAEQVGLMHDVAVGFDPCGADAWEWQDQIAGGFAIGAPPDEFNTIGQDWGLAAFDPWRLRAAGYRPFIETIRSCLRHASSVRLDHVMGLFRLFWVPDGAAPSQGAYVRYPASDLLDILALEAERAGAYVVGEDLGTVEPGTRRELAARNVLSYRLLWFEETDASRFPRKALCGVTTHDLPTVAGLWDGSDLQTQLRLGLRPNVEATEAILSRVRDATSLAPSAPIDDVVVAVYALIARAESMVLTATVEDMLAVRERPNMPGTLDTRPNWSLALPLVVEELVRAPLPRRVAAELRRD